MEINICFYFQEERSTLLKELAKLTAGEPGIRHGITLAMGSGERVDAAAGRRLSNQYYHAEGGINDGCYDLYNSSDVGQADRVLAQLEVGKEEWAGQVDYVLVCTTVGASHAPH